jgi:hypothetical protein
LEGFEDGRVAGSAGDELKFGGDESVETDVKHNKNDKGKSDREGTYERRERGGEVSEESERKGEATNERLRWVRPLATIEGSFRWRAIPLEVIPIWVRPSGLSLCKLSADATKPS